VVSRKDIYVVQDSDEILGVDVAEARYDQNAIQDGPLLPYHVLRWFVHGWPTDFHIWLSRHTVVTHADDLGEHYDALKVRVDWTLTYVYALLYLRVPIRMLNSLRNLGAHFSPRNLGANLEKLRKRIRKKIKRKFKGKFKGKFKKKKETKEDAILRQ
jgi:hypothetical protein